MLTTTETILLITVWSLTGIGMFFSVRARLRKRRYTRENRKPAEKPPPTQSTTTQGE